MRLHMNLASSRFSSAGVGLHISGGAATMTPFMLQFILMQSYLARQDLLMLTTILCQMTVKQLAFHS